MARRKKTEVVEEPVVVEVKLEEVKQKERVLFKVKAQNDNIALRKYPSLDQKLIEGYMDKNKIYDVLCVITCAAMPLYLLDNGYYVIADGNLLTL